MLFYYPIDCDIFSIIDVLRAVKNVFNRTISDIAPPSFACQNSEATSYARACVSIHTYQEHCKSPLDCSRLLLMDALTLTMSQVLSESFKFCDMTVFTLRDVQPIRKVSRNMECMRNTVYVTRLIS